jgi:hypothetical protein
VIDLPRRAFRSHQEVSFSAKVTFLACAEHVRLADHLHGVDLPFVTTCCETRESSRYLARIPNSGFLPHQSYNAEAALAKDPHDLVIIDETTNRITTVSAQSANAAYLHYPSLSQMVALTAEELPSQILYVSRRETLLATKFVKISFK